jgi:hypothetical protein
LFGKQFHTDRTLNRSARHYRAHRWTKIRAHNCSRHVNAVKHWPGESVAHAAV